MLLGPGVVLGRPSEALGGAGAGLEASGRGPKSQVWDYFYSSVHGAWPSLMPSVPRLQLCAWQAPEGHYEALGGGGVGSLSGLVLAWEVCLVGGGSGQAAGWERPASENCGPGATGPHRAGSNSISVTNPMAQGLE